MRHYSAHNAWSGSYSDGFISGIFEIVGAFVQLDVIDGFSDVSMMFLFRASRIQCLILAKLCSIGLRLGEYGGQKPETRACVSDGISYRPG
jgi:hypothetical protein